MAPMVPPRWKKSSRELRKSEQISDDPILAAAISQRDHYLVSYDKDFLDLETPYGVRCATPRAFISAVLSKL